MIWSLTRMRRFRALTLSYSHVPKSHNCSHYEGSFPANTWDPFHTLFASLLRVPYLPLDKSRRPLKTRSGPKIPAAGYLEGEGFFGFKDIDSDFGCCYEQFWNFVRTTEFWNFVRTTKFWNFVRTTEFWLFSRSWIFGLLALKMTLKVNSDYRFEIYGLCSLC